MNYLSHPGPTIYGFLYFPHRFYKVPDLSYNADYFFEELREISSVYFFVFQHIGPDFCHHTEIYTDASLELTEKGVLINTNISNN